MAKELRSAAFFDVDHTVLSINSGTAWIRNLRRQGRISWKQTLRSIGWLLQYRASLLDFEAMTRRALRDYRGLEADVLRDEVREWFHREVEPTISPHARACIEEHRARGHVLVLLTSATRYLSLPLAERLSIEHVLCTDLEEHQGRLTGHTRLPVCYGAGKVHWAERFSREHGVDLAHSYFYSDSYSDLPMLMRVGEPRVVNPDPRLRRRARAEGWRVYDWMGAVAAKEASQ